MCVCVCVCVFSHVYIELHLLCISLLCQASNVFDDSSNDSYIFLACISPALDTL